MAHIHWWWDSSKEANNDHLNAGSLKLLCIAPVSTVRPHGSRIKNFFSALNSLHSQQNWTFLCTVFVLDGGSWKTDVKYCKCFVTVPVMFNIILVFVLVLFFGEERDLPRYFADRLSSSMVKVKTTDFSSIFPQSNGVLVYFWRTCINVYWRANQFDKFSCLKYRSKYIKGSTECFLSGQNFFFLLINSILLNL